MVKKILFFSLALSMFFFACKEPQPVPEPKETLIADFDVSVSGEAPEAKVSIVNKTENATSFEWTFSEGADISNSTDENPPTITVDKAGDFTITLVASNSDTTVEISKTVSIEGHNAIVVYTDIEFGLNAGDQYGRFFSFETEKMYLDSEINDETGSKIDLAFESMENTLYYFQSPSESEFNIPNAKNTEIVNTQSPVVISQDDFNAMTDDRLLANLTIESDNDAFGNSQIPGNVILFEISSGRKGAILAKDVNGERLLVDIKIQKY